MHLRRRTICIRRHIPVRRAPGSPRTGRLRRQAPRTSAGGVQRCRPVRRRIPTSRRTTRLCRTSKPALLRQAISLVQTASLHCLFRFGSSIVWIWEAECNQRPHPYETTSAHRTMSNRVRFVTTVVAPHRDDMVRNDGLLHVGAPVWAPAPRCRWPLTKKADLAAGLYMISASWQWKQGIQSLFQGVPCGVGDTGFEPVTSTV